MKIAIINYDAGNVKSVQFALERLGVTPIITDNPEVLQSVDKVIFPGVGQAAFAMQSLKNKNLVGVIKNLQQPVLGICLGMQLMCNHSAEGNVSCLGIIDAPVLKFPTTVKVPCVGWNTLNQMQSPLYEGVNEGEYCYFVHSYYVPDNSCAIAKTIYGDITYAASLQKDNFYACQFHPEKSGDTGEKIMKNFLKQTL
jgi:imidazole glycerol-phosphate synthase subunit HisH